jgi:hypothetical protein
MLVDALDDRDAAAAAAVGGPSSADLLRAVAANAGALDVTDLSLRYVDELGATSSDGRWRAAVAATWRFGDVDRSPVSEEIAVDFQASGDGVVVAGFSGGSQRQPLWLSGPLEVRRAGSTLVASLGTAESADAASARAVAAVAVVRRVLPGWSGNLVVEVPSSQDQLDAALGADPGSYDAVAAVTASVDGSVEPGASLHVFLNPDVYDALDPVGAQVVMSHEATHVATDAPLHALPSWLLEGFADYVALRDVDLPLTTTAGQVIDEVRQDGLPAALPGAAEFDEGSDYFGAAYEASWLACRTVADQAGQEALVDLYERVSDGTELGPALRSSAGLTVAELTAAWRTRLQDLAA